VRLDPWELRPGQGKLRIDRGKLRIDQGELRLDQGKQAKAACTLETVETAPKVQNI
jgi:hypothetical protein